MMQIVDAVDVTGKIADKIAAVETRNRRKMSAKEKAIATEMFMSGFLFSQQWNGNEFTINPHED